MSTETTAPVREIDRYRLVQRIGAGGYGEVWKADAPGGLSKAVKLVFGFHDEARASRELKALNRIKNLRHPFLLSLERIEVIDAQLVVVTELADCCLKDRFDACRAEGLPGIPRAELLRFLADAAEALDYMTEVHSLQHLDVKPENLLIVGSHAKVADFGLVKSIQDVTASMMAGLTPLYASPEVFNDSPSRQSDQYSLAIVYQEMLTGALPFPGRNLAQLTAQHLSSPPRLNPLPPRDRDILSKALAKKPQERYRNCTEMVDALLAADSTAHLPQVRGASFDQSEPAKTDTKTINCNDTNSSDQQLRATSDPETMRMDGDAEQRFRSSKVWGEIARRDQKLLPPVADDRTQRELRPSVVVGIGGLGNRILRQFIDRRLELFGTQRQQHWCQCIAVDTDMNDLLEATGQLSASADAPSLACIEMPLRRPQAYRSLSTQLTRSLSRRWLYNIPLSLKTEGMRPLGRLAFADHASRLRDQMHQAVEQAVRSATEAIRPDSEAYCWQSRPRIVLVMSSSGGTGSGMVWDAFAMAQEVVQEYGGTADDVSLWLLHASPSGAEQLDLARCNTYACFRELFHFQATGQYPGDAVTKIPPQHWSDKISRQVTIFETGDVSSNQGVQADVQDIADLLYMNVYEGREVAQQRRNDPPTGDPSIPSVSAWSLSGKALCTTGHLDIAAARYSVELLRRWQGTCTAGQEQRRLASLNDANQSTGSRTEQYQKVLELRAAKAFQETNFGLEQVINLITQVVEDAIEATPEAYFSDAIGRMISDLLAQGHSSGSCEMSVQVLDSLDQLIGVSNPDAGPGKRTAVSLHSEIAPHIRQITQHFQDRVLSQIHAMLDESGFRIRGVKQLGIQVDHLLNDLEAKARAMGEKTSLEVEKIRAVLSPVLHRQAKRGGRHSEAGLSNAELRKLWLSYALLRSHGVVVMTACQVFQHLRTAVLRDNMWTNNTLVNLELAERKIREKLALEDEAARDDPKFLEKILVLEQTVDNILDAEHGGLCRLLHVERNGVDKLVQVLLDAGKELARASAMAEGGEVAPLNSSPWQQHKSADRCRLTELGPTLQRFVFLPTNVAHTPDSPTEHGTKLGTKLPKVIWLEAATQIPLREAARLLIENRPDYVPVADRLLTRADIRWAEL